MTSEELKDYQKRLGKSNVEFAKILDRSVEALANWKNGKIVVPNWVVGMMSSYLQRRLEEYELLQDEFNALEFKRLNFKK